MKLTNLGPTLLILLLSCTTLPAQHPSAYGEVKGRANEAVFSFPELEREIVHVFPASFYAPEPISMRFRVLVRPDGSVKYVKPILDPSIPANFRLGGAHALYRYEFAPVQEAQGDQWVETVMQVGKK